ncbi:MAG TPA: hypothetical protein VMT56_02965 [Candidatus Bathyarchaeia archaeon]|nr:hypothetical protein [Candidatus Bathyarchaeia archaeon]
MMTALLVLAVIFAPTMANPNGSPINTGEIRRTGNIQMIQKKDIGLEDERLSVRIAGDFAFVQVIYRLRNSGPADKVTYGFPVESDPAFDSDYKPIEKSTLTDFRISEGSDSQAQGRVIPVEKVVSDKTEEPPGEDMKPFMSWHIVTIPFQEYEEKTISVSYRQKCRLEDIVFTKSFRPRFSHRTFAYTLKPAQNWGEGSVTHCSVLIDARELLGQGGNILEIHPEGCSANGGIISWNYQNLDLHTAKDIELVYDNSDSAFTKYVQESRLPLSSIAKIQASSILKTDAINRFNYEPKNLFDNDLNTAWVEGAAGSGVGEWVEVQFEEGVHIEAVGIINGYTKNEAIYKANNRIRKIRLDVEFRDHWPANADPKSEDIDLTEKQFNELNRDVQAPFISWLADYGMGRVVSKIRITILEVAPGAKYDDTCISELYLLGYVPGS